MPHICSKSMKARGGAIRTESFFLLLLLLAAKHAESGNIVKTLPGYSGTLPFELETGYVTVGESELFYMFVESQGKPRLDPLLIYLIGGPGCSTLIGFFFQVGPLIFNTTDYPGGLPELLDNPYAWTKTASIIFVDAPVGTGYSYASSPEGYYIDDTESATQIHLFIRKWLLDHPHYILTQFLVASDSYSGVLAPIIAQQILEGNAAGLHPRVNLKGIIGGSAHTDSSLETNADVPLAYRLALISRSLYESAKNSCNGDYVDVDASNAECLEVLDQIDELIAHINDENILDPKCATVAPIPNPGGGGDRLIRRSLGETPIRRRRYPFPPSGLRDFWCRNFEYILVDVWANDEEVQQALHVRPGTIKEWRRCNLTLSQKAYTYNIGSVVSYYENLTSTGLQILHYGGDHDMIVPYTSTIQWIKSLNLTVDSIWRPWYEEGQVAGYTFTDIDYSFRLTFATLKGAGHSPTQYKPKDCFNMFSRWIHYYPL